MNQPLALSAELGYLAEAFEDVSCHLPLAYSRLGPDLTHLSDSPGELGELVSHLSAKIQDTHVSIVASTPAARHPHANTATRLARAARAVGRAISALAVAQDDQIFIDHYASLSEQSHYRANADAARLRIGTRLTTARTALAEATSLLRDGAVHTDLAEQRVLAARTRSPQATATSARSSSTPSTGFSAPPPSPGRKR